MNNVGKGRPRKEPSKARAIVKEFRKKRIASGLSVRQVAEATGYHADTIKGWEAGKYPPTLYKFMDACEVVGLKVMVTPSAYRLI